MIQIGLKLKLSILIGILLSIVMGVWSLVILVDQRGLLISKHVDIATAIIKSYSVPLTDTFMFEDMGILPIEGTFENYIEQMMRQEDMSVRYVSILSEDFKTIAHNNTSEYGRYYYDSIVENTSRTRDLSLGIVQHPDHGWILEVAEPLRISGKLWGYLVIAFDAEVIRQQIQNLFIYLVTTTILVIAVTILAGFFISDRLTKSLNEMVAVIDKYDIRSGKLMSVPESNDEIGFLARSFRQMQERLYTSRRDLEKAQRETYHAEKLASIGQLASGVAHEINNPLMGLKNCINTMTNEPDNIGQNREYLQLMQDGAEKIESVVSKLLEFSYKKTREWGDIDISESVDRLLKLVGYKLSNNKIETEVNIESGLHVIRGDRQLLEEVFMNITINAIDAMPAGGLLSISATNLSMEKVSISFTDTGIGMSPAVIDLIFDPFFTTKDIGKGTGLGLSLSRRIVEEHGGTITLKSNVGQGTTFFVQLPVEASQDDGTV